MDRFFFAFVSVFGQPRDRAKGRGRRGRGKNETPGSPLLCRANNAFSRARRLCTAATSSIRENGSQFRHGWGVGELKQGGGCAYSPYGPYYKSNTHLARCYIRLSSLPLLSLTLFSFPARSIRWMVGGRTGQILLHLGAMLL